MAIFEGGRGFFWGFLAGVGVAVVARETYPSFRGVAKPLGKAAIKAGITTIEKARDSLALIGEEAEDLVAEVRAEMQAEAQAEQSGADVKPESSAQPNGAARPESSDAA